MLECANADLTATEVSLDDPRQLLQINRDMVHARLGLVDADALRADARLIL